jgi:predicted nucleotide-binding protein
MWAVQCAGDWEWMTMTTTDELFKRLDDMGRDEVLLALAEGRFNERKAKLAKHWLDATAEPKQPAVTTEQARLLTELADDFSDLLGKFVKGGQFGVPFLPTEGEAEFRSLLSNARASLREYLGPTHEFTFQLMRIDTALNFNEGASVANIQEVVAALKGAIRYLASRPKVPNARTAIAAMPMEELLKVAAEEDRLRALDKANFDTRTPEEIELDLLAEVYRGQGTSPTPAAPKQDDKPTNTKVFVVHGHDHGSRDMVARFLEHLGLDPIILDEQANRNRTIIEKLEGHSDVTFAVVLLTADDEGRSNKEKAAGKEARSRARQNVILELGYFVGHLKRHRVCALAKGDIEIPSDLSGIICEAMDDAGAWKAKLARELDDAGYTLDWRRVGLAR